MAKLWINETKLMYSHVGLEYLWLLQVASQEEWESGKEPPEA